MYKGLLDNNLLDNRIEEVDIWSIGIITYDNRTTTKKTQLEKQEINNNKKKTQKTNQKIISNSTNRKKGTKAVQQEESNKTVRHILFSN